MLGGKAGALFLIIARRGGAESVLNPTGVVLVLVRGQK